jgi:hypothetical protein
MGSPRYATAQRIHLIIIIASHRAYDFMHT